MTPNIRQLFKKPTLLWTKRRMYAAEAAASDIALARRSQWPQCYTVALNVGSKLLVGEILYFEPQFRRK